MLPKKYEDGLFMYTTIQPTQQLKLPIGVKEEILPQARKRVAIVSVKLVKEASLYYANRTIRNPRDGADFCREFLGDVTCEHFVVLCLNVKNQPTHINIAHIGSLNASVIHPREVFKPAILANAASIMLFHKRLFILLKTQQLLLLPYCSIREAYIVKTNATLHLNDVYIMFSFILILNIRQYLISSKLFIVEMGR